MERIVQVISGPLRLEASLSIPAGARGIVLFAHGSGSSRASPRNRLVASALQAGGLATLLLDLLTREEEIADSRTGHLRFDVELLAERLIVATDWVAAQALTRDLRIGYFGASTGVGAALLAARDRPETVRAVASRGGRPDLAGAALAWVRSPTLLIVGGEDRTVLRLNREALSMLRCEKQLEVVPGATHLFEEPGALEQVARLARAWLVRHLAPAASPEARTAAR